MDLEKIFNEICGKFKMAEKEKIPISDLVRERGFRQIDKEKENECYRAVLEKENYKIIASIVSYEHDGTFVVRWDTFHNYLELYKDGESIYTRGYMYEDNHDFMWGD